MDVDIFATPQTTNNQIKDLKKKINVTIANDGICIYMKCNTFYVRVEQPYVNDPRYQNVCKKTKFAPMDV